MQRKTNRFVIGRENNVVRVDFSRDLDPPALEFPGASGSLVISDQSASEVRYNTPITQLQTAGAADIRAVSFPPR